MITCYFIKLLNLNDNKPITVQDPGGGLQMKATK